MTATVATIADIEADVLGSFRPEPGAPRSACLVEVAGTPDNPDFAQHVVEAVERDHPRMAGRTVLVDEPHPTPRTEVADWYRRGRALAVDEPGIDECFEQLARHGLNVAGIDRPAALRDVRRSRLRRCEVVLAAGTAASVVVIPLQPGTRVEPIGGYPAVALHPWQPIGVTGVVRGAERNAAVIADADVEVLAIPAERYLADWFRPYTSDELRLAWHRWLADDGA